MDTSQQVGDQGGVFDVARRISERVIAPGFAVDQATTVLLLNSLLSALHERHRIYLNAFQRSGEILNYFGHRLRRLGFDVHLLDPYAIIPGPQQRDVMISLSGSLRTEPVLVSLLHADLGGLYNFVLTGQTADEARRRFQGVLPVHIPGVTAQGRAADSEVSQYLPLGGLFELRAFLYLEGIVEVLGEVLAAGVPPAAEPQGPLDPFMLRCLGEVRERAGIVSQVMESLVRQFVETLPEVSEQALDELVEDVREAVVGGHGVFVAGYGRNNEIGCMFAYRLASLGIPVAMTPSRLERPKRPGDLLIAVSGSGFNYEVLQRLSGARRGQLNTAVMTASRDSSVAKFADSVVVVPAILEGRSPSQVASRGKPPASAPPTGSTFALNCLFLLEAVFAVLLSRLGRTEADLVHPDSWQSHDDGDE